MNNPASLNQTGCTSRNCGLWTHFPLDPKFFGEVILTERKLEAEYFRNHASRSISESQSRYIIVESHTSNNSSATKLKYRRITVSSPSQIGSDNDRSLSSVCSANESYPPPHNLYCLHLREMDDSITVLLLSEAHAMAFHEEVY